MLSPPGSSRQSVRFIDSSCCRRHVIRSFRVTMPTRRPVWLITHRCRRPRLRNMSKVRAMEVWPYTTNGARCITRRRSIVVELSSASTASVIWSAAGCSAAALRKRRRRIARARLAAFMALTMCTTRSRSTMPTRWSCAVTTGKALCRAADSLMSASVRFTVPPVAGLSSLSSSEDEPESAYCVLSQSKPLRTASSCAFVITSRSATTGVAMTRRIGCTACAGCGSLSRNGTPSSGMRLW
mmetsp:Transcript_5048/g.18175  ORF Transcript_5048/g.18175 Transcript_5048/m.18175 type:complete len:240 (-) Transcript_5048:100-819(-)